MFLFLYVFTTSICTTARYIVNGHPYCHLTRFYCSFLSIGFVAGNADAFVRLLSGIDCAAVLFVMNVVWFSRILKGVKKTLLKWSRSTRLHGQELSTELGVPAVLRCDLEV
jgi:hypothetical protein